MTTPSLPDALRACIAFPMRDSEFRDKAADLIRQHGPALEALLRERDELRRVCEELADDLEGEIESRRDGELPRRIERDLSIVREARALLAGPKP